MTTGMATITATRITCTGTMARHARSLPRRGGSAAARADARAGHRPRRALLSGPRANRAPEITTPEIPTPEIPTESTHA